MKNRKKAKARAGRARKAEARPKYDSTRSEEKPEKFTAMETGQVDRDAVEGRGPLAQEGEGERQNDQLAELERIRPEEAPPHRRGR